MDELLLYQQNLLGTFDEQFRRFLYPQLSKERRMLAIKGLWGSGKTTLLLQYLKFGLENKKDALYEDEKEYLTKLYNVINATLTSDLAFIENYSASPIAKLKTLLGVIAESAPFEPNISALAQKLTLGRVTVIHFLQSLEKGRLPNLLNKSAKAVAAMQKPDKIYLENTNFSYALKSKPDVGTIRETFFLNQIRNAGLQINQATMGDFLVDEKWTFEIGGKGKSSVQIKDVPDSFIVSDQLERGALNRIPLWLFGFLY